jgi:hypothetical protein
MGSSGANLAPDPSREAATRMQPTAPAVGETALGQSPWQNQDFENPEETNEENEDEAENGHLEIQAMADHRPRSNRRPHRFRARSQSQNRNHNKAAKGRQKLPDAARDFFRPVGASPVLLTIHGLRRGLQSSADSRLPSRGFTQS